MRDTTIIYYSSNREHPKFEQRIIQTIKDNSNGLPVISVTQKPMDFGHNICVGEKPNCYSNAFKQLLIGLEAAETRFCLAAEADCLYPPEYFQFEPPHEDRAYRYRPVWVYYPKYKKAWHKQLCEGAQMCGREYWIQRVREVLRGRMDWDDPIPNRKLSLIFKTGLEFSWSSENPVITFKTGQGVSYGCGFDRGVFSKEFPYWGTVKDIYTRYLEDL